MCKGGLSSQQGGKTFARSLIKNDEYQTFHPACKSLQGKNCDAYAFIYLDGNPNDSKFEGGDQGFNALFEEVVQYVNSLIVGYAFADKKPAFGASSDRDGILTFLWYVERYLRMGRQDFPQAYKVLRDDKCWREAILTIWGRAWFYLEKTKNMKGLGINDKKLEGLVKNPELLNEIQLLRNKQGCP